MPEPDTTPAAPDDVHVCNPGATTYYCPTAGETESDCHGGFDTCCDRPDLHQPVRLCDRCGHAADERSIYGCHDECGCPDRPDLDLPPVDNVPTEVGTGDTSPNETSGTVGAPGDGIRGLLEHVGINTTPAACGFRHDEWDGPYRMPRRCTAPAGHSDGQFAYDHGPWEGLPLGWRDQPADGTTSGTSGRTETGATIANAQARGGETGDSGADSRSLRERYAGAARTVRLHLGPNAIAMARRGEGIIPNYGEADRIADAALAVRDLLTPPADQDRGGQ